MRLFFVLIGFAGVAGAQIIVNPDGGPDVSYLVIEAEDFGAPLYYGYRYTFDEESPMDGYALASAIDEAVEDLELDWINYGDALEPNFFLTAITFGVVTLTNFVDFEAGIFDPYWAQSVSGGAAGFPVAEPVSAQDWTLGSGASAPYRYHANGSADGYVYGDGSMDPSIAPVPEPAAWLLFLTGIAGVAARVRSCRRA